MNQRFLFFLIILFSILASCKSELHESNWFDENNLTICQYLEKNQDEFSKSYRLLVEGKMLNPLCGYNPYGEDYTLFLPTDEAIDNFIQQSADYENFEELLLDTNFVYSLARYHTVKRKIHTDEFPDGALLDSTLTGDRLSIGVYSDGDKQLIKINNGVPIIRSNLEMTNGYIHVISKVLLPVKISGLDWLQENDDYSILAQAMEYCRIPNRLWFDKYTILAEPDSVFYRKGIMNLDDLIKFIAPPGSSNNSNAFYQFTAYHIIRREFYLNDFYWGNEGYRTLSSQSIMINVGLEIGINTGVDTYGIKISDSGDTTNINFIRPIWEISNIKTSSGPVHSITDILYFNPLSK